MDLAPALERLAALEAKIEAQGATLRADVAQMRAQIETLPGAVAGAITFPPIVFPALRCSGNTKPFGGALVLDCQERK